MIDTEIQNSKSIYPCYEDISDFIFFNFGKNIYPDTLRNIIHEFLGKTYKTVTGVGMEYQRLEWNLLDIEINLLALKEKVDGMPTHFVFNLDEVGISEYEDSEEKKVIVPTNYPFKTAPYGISRKEKHSSALVCISMDGLFCSPQIAVQRKTVDSEIYDHIQIESAQIVHTNKGYVNSQSFRYFIQNEFIPKLREMRKRYYYNGKSVL